MPPEITTRDRWSTPPSIINVLSRLLAAPPSIDLAASHHDKRADYMIGESTSNLWGLHGIDDYHFLHSGLFGVQPEQVLSRLDELGERSWAWLNPPFSRGNPDRFCAWAGRYSDSGGQLALLTSASMSDGWYQRHVAPRTHTILVPTSRIEFIAPDGVTASRPMGNHIISIMGPGVPRRPAHVIFFDWRDGK